MKFRLHYAKLFRRLAIGGTIIAATLGGSILWYQVEKVDDEFVDLAFGQIMDSVKATPALATPGNADKQPEMQEAINKLVMINSKYFHGDFIIAELYDASFNLVAEATEPNLDIESRIDRNPHRFPEGKRVQYTKYLIDSNYYLLVLSPLFDSQGRRSGYLEGVFRVSKAAVDEVQQEALNSALIAALAVIGSVLILYPVILRLDRHLLQRTHDLLDSNLATLQVLGNAIAKRDSDTGDHNFRVTLVSVRIAEAAGLGKGAIRELIKGAFLHDVGKIAISDKILLKPGRLDADEFAVMKTHVQHGVEILDRLSWLDRAADVVRYHHEKFDGSGYPNGLAGKAIPITARVFAIADVFDALVSERPYKRMLSLEETLQIMIDGRGSHFDPELLDLFTAMAARLHADFFGKGETELAEELDVLSEIYFRDALD